MQPAAFFRGASETRIAMPATLYTASFAALKDTDTVTDATRQMLADRVSDLPVVDGDGKLVGIFKLDRLLAALLPKAALLGYGLDLSFVADTLEQLRDKMRDIESDPVTSFTVHPDHVVHPETTPIEIVLLIYRGANNVPVVDPSSGRLVGMVSARDVLAALHGEGAI
jgi:CBS-domain-containing membrane protein